ncbi:hypothetical protein L596_017519 [Steinernema carpocapsae]|uniref:Uncharacterized protein n=1 Tax=Steinernema carpocapsae TaxID=34508 RepID=A0A4U5N2M0_STECR|nr:hypothetical protein L596_017519 [Steinernema carpocapsae]
MESITRLSYRNTLDNTLLIIIHHSPNNSPNCLGRRGRKALGGWFWGSSIALSLDFVDDRPRAGLVHASVVLVGDGG